LADKLAGYGGDGPPLFQGSANVAARRGNVRSSAILLQGRPDDEGDIQGENLVKDQAAGCGQQVSPLLFQAPQVCARQGSQANGNAGVEGDNLFMIGPQDLGIIAKDLALALVPSLLHGEVVNSQYHVLGGSDHRAPVFGIE